MARRLVYYVACTVDGFIAREDGSFDWALSEGEHFADLIEKFPETFPAHLRQVLGVSQNAARLRSDHSWARSASAESSGWPTSICWAA